MSKKKAIAQLAFEFYLLKNDYSELSQAGNESTVRDYSNRVVRICEQEGYATLDELSLHIQEILSEIDEKEDMTKNGTKVDKNDKSALKKFYEFILKIS